ncbi:Putative transposon Ty5-1 protein YCL075W [Linum grandiflorum]
MKLRPEFEAARSSLIANKTAEFDTVIGELIRVETRLRTQTKLDGHSIGAGFSIQSARKKRNFYNYCKRPGHTITDCGIRKRNDTRSNSSGSSSSSGGRFVSHRNSLYSSQLVDNSSAPPSDMNQLVKAALSQVLPEALHSAFASFGVTGKNQNWLLDSAAFNHMTSDRSNFKTYQFISHMGVQVVNGHTLPVVGIGHVSTPTLELPDTLHVPQLVPNLISVGQLTDNGHVVSFSSTGCFVQDQKNQIQTGTGNRVGRNFHLHSLIGSYREANEHDGSEGDGHCHYSRNLVSGPCNSQNAFVTLNKLPNSIRK